jgi:hypothetical protein
MPATGRHCLAGARLYPAGWLCDEHAPGDRTPQARPCSLDDFGSIREAARYSGCTITDIQLPD